MKKKSVRKRTGHTRTVPMSDEVYQALLDQRQRFIDKFGREPGPSDPLFFDPDTDTPQQITEEKLNRLMNEAFSAAGIDPVLVYAYNKTGLLVSEDNLHLLGDEDLAEWQQAVDEAEQMFRKNRA
jgi:integrase